MARMMMLKAAVVLRFLGKVAMGCWAWSGTMLLGCVLLYWVYGGFLALLLLCIALAGIIYHAEDHLLYHPEQPSHSRVFVPVPSMFGLPYENLFIRSLDGTMLHMFFIRQPPPKATTSPTILFLHGNAGNMGHRLHNALGLYHQIGCNILLMDYRGYGMSQGSPSEDGLYLDAQAALHFLTSRKDVNHNEIVVFGRSLGGSVAIDLACRVDCAPKIWCVIVENSFTSIPDMAHILLGSRIIKSLPLICYKNKFPSYDKVPCMARPALFVSGLADTLVPPRMMTQLSQRCGSIHKQLLCFETGSHNETWTCHGYYHALNTFLQELRGHSHEPVAQTPPPMVRPPATSQASL